MKGEVTILGVDFFTGSAQEAVVRILEGGLLVAPSGPGLSKNLVEDSWYGEALDASDIVLPDSGLMILLWNLSARRGGPKIRRVSGLEFLDCFLRSPSVRQRMDRSFWVMPSEPEKQRNLEWLRKDLQFEALQEEATYVAPMYPSGGDVADENLLEAVRLHDPLVVFLNIGGGVQERVGHYLKQNLNPCPAILCCGAAIAFLAGGQVRIPKWADSYKLGWLLRCFHNPVGFVPRYWMAKSLVPLLLRHRDRRPPLRTT